MERHIIRNLLAAVLAGGVLFSACTNSAAPPAQEAQRTTQPVATEAPTARPTPRPDSGGVRLADGTVVANAKVAPLKVLNLNFEINGVVTEVLVQPGDLIKAGDPLARFDIRQIELNLAIVRTQLIEAKASYEGLLAGATPEQIARAQAQIDAASARLDANQNNVTNEEIAAAQAELREARLVFNQLRAGPKNEDIAILQSSIDVAEARLQTRRDSLSVEKNRIETDIGRLSNLIQNRQDAYNEAYWRNQAQRASGNTPAQDDLDLEARLLRDVEDAELLRKDALLALEEAKKREVTEILAYEAEVREAKARLNRLLLGPDPDQIAAAEKRILRAESALSKLTGAERIATIDTFAAQVREAEANLAVLQADPRSSDLAIAKARIARAEVNVKQAELDLDRSVVYAPFTATVARVAVSANQVVQQGDPAFVLADLSAWKLEATDLSELNISAIREGDPVTITFFAVPGLQLTGHVSYIETVGRDNGVGTSYNVIIIPESWDDRLRWNMSAQVFFEPTG